MINQYFPHTPSDVKEMLERVGVNSLDDLYSDVPSEHIYKGDYDLAPSMSEEELRRYFDMLAGANENLVCFAGGGAYNHYCPSVVDYILSRSEFLTAYTPYQAEISQGTLRYIFEFQTMITRLTGLEVANASLYDGATAAAEAMLMCLAATKKKTRVLVHKDILPNVLEVVKTYAHYHEVALTEVSLDELEGELAAGDVAGLITPNIDRFGYVVELEGVAEKLHAAKALLAVYSTPVSLALLKTPAEWGADIAVGDCQSLGFPLSFGGPYCGYMATRMDYVRKMPGRVVGQTLDKNGKRCFCLTLQAREQHIRREKATSNICSNQSLMALYSTVYLSLMGPRGLREVAELSYKNAHYLYNELLNSGMFKEAFPGKTFFNEFTLELRPGTSLAENGCLCEALAGLGILGALEVGEGLVSFAATERTTAEEIKYLMEILKSL